MDTQLARGSDGGPRRFTEVVPTPHAYSGQWPVKTKRARARSCAAVVTRKRPSLNRAAFPIQDDDHLLVVLRYVERNPLHAGLVGRAKAWEWSSLHGHAQGPLALWLDLGPVPRGPQWVEAVNAPMFETELAPIRRSLQRDAPFGSEAWTLQTAIALGLESSLKPLGRSRTTADQGAGIQL